MTSNVLSRRPLSSFVLSLTWTLTWKRRSWPASAGRNTAWRYWSTCVSVTLCSLKAPVEIFLHEGLVGDAIALVDAREDDVFVDRVVEAALESHPDWVIQTCRQRAERIMYRAKSEKYANAFDWLAKAMRAYRAAGRDEEWRAYLDGLLTRHFRKYRLVPMLKVLKEQ